MQPRSNDGNISGIVIFLSRLILWILSPIQLAHCKCSAHEMSVISVALRVQETGTAPDYADSNCLIN